MFVARDAKGNLVNALEKDVTKQAYTCPACGGRLRLRQGQSIRTHFAHERLRDCIAIFENESPEHMGNKEALYHWAKKDNQVALEYSLPEIQQVADVLVNGKLALEVQCSPLSQKLLGDRSQGYRSQGYQVIWLLGEKLWSKYGFLCLGTGSQKENFETQISSASGPTWQASFSGQRISLWSRKSLGNSTISLSETKTASFCSCARFNYLSLHSPAVVLSNALLDEKTGGSLLSRRQSIKPST